MPSVETTESWWAGANEPNLGNFMVSKRQGYGLSHTFLGPDSTSAAEAAHCAGDQYRFWEYHDYLYTNQGFENSGWAAIAQLNQFASSLGLDATQFAACLNNGKYLQEVKNETAACHQQNINATPGFVINGTIMMGAEPLSTFEQAINSALRH